jgi:hypothetical protein
MPKPVALTPELVDTPQIMPAAAAAPRRASRRMATSTPAKAEQVRLQLRSATS